MAALLIGIDFTLAMANRLKYLEQLPYTFDRDNDKRNVVRLLARLQDINTLRLTVFLTSRPELPVGLGSSTLTGDLHHDIKLEEVQASIIEQDIRTYLEHQFRAMKEEDWALQPYDPLPTDRPRVESIETLVMLAVPPFIFAFIVYRFVSEADPRARHRNLCCNSPKEQRFPSSKQPIYQS